MRGLAARIKRLERRAKPPVRARSNVVEIDAVTRKPINPLPPKGTRVVVVPRFENWAESLIQQQQELIASAGINDETQNERH